MERTGAPAREGQPLASDGEDELRGVDVFPAQIHHAVTVRAPGKSGLERQSAPESLGLEIAHPKRTVRELGAARDIANDDLPRA